MPQQYRARIHKEGVEVEFEGDKRFVLEMLKQFADPTPQSSPQSPAPGKKAAAAASTGHVSKTAKGTSPGEFIRRLGSTKHTDLVLGFGYYLEKISGLSAFTPADVNTCYYESKLESSNTSQMIILNIKKTYLMPAKKADDGKKKKYTLTRSGEQFIESLLDKNPVKA